MISNLKRLTLPKTGDKWPLRNNMAQYNGHGHLYDDSSAPSLHGKNREIGAKEVNIKWFLRNMAHIDRVANLTRLRLNC